MNVNSTRIEIPVGWSIRRLRDLCTLVNGRGFKPYEWSDRGLPIIRIQNLNGSSEFNYFDGSFDPKIAVTHGELLFAWSGSRGSSFGPHIWMGGDAVLNYHTWKIVPRSKVDSRFLFHALRGLTRSIEESAHGASALVHVQKWEMEGLELHTPPIEEQRAIANVLDDIDQETRALQLMATKKRALKRAMMQELLTGRSRLPGHTGPREGFTFGQILAYEQPGRYLVASADYTGSGIPVLTAGKTFLLGYTAEVAGAYAAVPVVIFDDFTTDSKFVTFRFKAKSSAMKMLSARPGFDLRWAYERMQLIELDTVDHKRRWIGEYSKIVVEVPTLDEQRDIARVAADADAEIEALDRRVEASRAIRQGMMQELLTGRTRLPVDQGVAV